MGWIYATEKRTSSITCMIMHVSNGTTWGNARKTINWTYKDMNGNIAFTGTSYMDSNQNDGGTLKAIGLKPNTRYTIIAEIWAESGGYWVEYIVNPPLTGTATTTQGWAWSFPTTSGSLFALTPLEWNYFRTAINNARVANNYDAYHFTPIESCKITPLGMPYWVLLQVVNAIDEVSHNLAPQLKSAKTGDKFYGWWFDHLASALNSIL